MRVKTATASLQAYEPKYPYTNHTSFRPEFRLLLDPEKCLPLPLPVPTTLLVLTVLPSPPLRDMRPNTLTGTMIVM